MRLTSLTVVELPMHLGLQVAEVMSEQELVFGLAGRTCGDAEEVGELSLAFAAAALGLRDMSR